MSVNARAPLSNISNQRQSSSLQQQQQQQQQKKNIFQPSTQSTSKVSIFNHEDELEKALKKIKELEELNKSKDETISTQTLEIKFLISTDDEKLTIKQNNNRLRKLQQFKTENETLQKKLDEALYNNEKSDILTKKLNQHRIRLIQKLKAENQELRNQLNSNNSNVNTVDIIEEEQQKHNQIPPQLVTATPSIEKNQPTKSIHQHHYQNNLDFDYGMDNEHPGEC
ncbi:hypothetical protein RB653_008510 [Dictyostelium firmibasis]|uniref:Uncharacterized protein n=1 Tax=Dictyostelium firmibasis TaxID=79012 RepID=A0AAN7TR65_9MYCE